MKTPEKQPLPTRELPTNELPPCRCGRQQSGQWTGGSVSHWLMAKPEGSDQTEPGLIEYECLSCKRRYRLRGNRFLEVLASGSERPYMRLGQYGRWLSLR